MKKSEQIKRFKLLYFSALNLGGMPESFLEKLDYLALQIEKEHPQVNEAFDLYEKAVVKAIDSLEMDFPFFYELIITISKVLKGNITYFYIN